MLMNKSTSMLKATSAKAATPLRPSLISRTPTVKVAASQGFDSNWLRKDPIVLGISFMGWTLPSNIGTSALDGQSLFGAFYNSIGENFAKFPQGPALDDKFWLYMITWHVGLFSVMLLGQVGVQGKKQGYW